MNEPSEHFINLHFIFWLLTRRLRLRYFFPYCIFQLFKEYSNLTAVEQMTNWSTFLLLVYFNRSLLLQIHKLAMNYNVCCRLVTVKIYNFLKCPMPTTSCWHSALLWVIPSSLLAFGYYLDEFVSDYEIWRALQDMYHVDKTF